jgi:hypothetical protein
MARLKLKSHKIKGIAKIIMIPLKALGFAILLGMPLVSFAFLIASLGKPIIDVKLAIFWLFSLIFSAAFLVETICYLERDKE